MDNNHERFWINLKIMSLTISIIFIGLNLTNAFSSSNGFPGGLLFGIMGFLLLAVVTFVTSIVLSLKCKDSARIYIPEAIFNVLIGCIIFLVLAVINENIVSNHEKVLRQKEISERNDKDRKIIDALVQSGLYGQFEKIDYMDGNDDNIGMYEVFYTSEGIAKLTYSNISLAKPNNWANNMNSLIKYFVLIDLTTNKILQVIDTDDIIREMKDKTNSDNKEAAITINSTEDFEQKPMFTLEWYDGYIRNDWVVTFGYDRQNKRIQKYIRHDKSDVRFKK